MRKYSSFVGGAWTEPHANDWIAVENPYSRVNIGTVVETGADDVNSAVRSASEAFADWSARTYVERAVFLAGVADQIEQRFEEFASLISDEVGTPIRTARAIQTQLPIKVLRGYAETGQAPETLEMIGNSRVFREPAGVVAAITPWNYPLHQAVCKLAPALLAGCTIVLKPSEIAPLAVGLLFEILDEVGVPPGVANLVNGAGETVGEQLATHADVDMVSFTGSVRVGARVASLAAPSIKRVALELGGKSANVLLPDAPIEAGTKVGVANAFLNGGQTCTAWTRMLVPADRHEDVLRIATDYTAKMVMGDPRDESTRIGPMVSATQAERVRGFIARGLSDGASLVCGGTDLPSGLEGSNFVAPTVLGGVDPNAEVAQEEVFGPVLSVIPYADEDEALAIANNSKYGLHGSVWSDDSDRALAFARRMRTGTVDINGAAYNKDAPFGGYKQSGFGREMGTYGLYEFQEVKSVQI